MKYIYIISDLFCQRTN